MEEGFEWLAKQQHPADQDSLHGFDPTADLQ
jgi:hypothetical protein